MENHPGIFFIVSHFPFLRPTLNPPLLIQGNDSTYTPFVHEYCFVVMEQSMRAITRALSILD
jgi:hypothetical protein